MAKKIQGANNTDNKDMPTTNSKEKKTYKLKSYVPGVDGPKYIGGSAPNPAKSVMQILKGAQNAYNFITKG